MRAGVDDPDTIGGSHGKRRDKAIDSNFPVLTQTVNGLLHVQGHFLNPGHAVRWPAFGVLADQTEGRQAAQGDALRTLVRDQGVLAVPLEVVLELVEGDVVGVAPNRAGGVA